MHTAALHGGNPGGRLIGTVDTHTHTNQHAAAAAMSIVLPEVAGGRIVGIACRALLRGGPEAQYECLCRTCQESTTAAVFAAPEALADHWEIGRLSQSQDDNLLLACRQGGLRGILPPWDAGSMHSSSMQNCRRLLLQISNGWCPMV